MCAANGKNVGRKGECGRSHVQPSVKCWVEEAVRLPPKSPRPIGWAGVLPATVCCAPVNFPGHSTWLWRCLSGSLHHSQPGLSQVQDAPRRACSRLGLHLSPCMNPCPAPTYGVDSLESTFSSNPLHTCCLAGSLSPERSLRPLSHGERTHNGLQGRFQNRAPSPECRGGAGGPLKVCDQAFHVPEWT